MKERTFWQSILDTNGTIPEGATLGELTDELLAYLHSPDPELRDTFAYQLLTHWIVAEQYSSEELERFLECWLSDLQTGLGEQNTDTVIVRSFAALMLSVLVYRDNKESWLSETNHQRLLDAILDYFQKEADLRGYDARKGWLHATAHTADVLKFLARNPKTEHDSLQKILSAIQAKLSYPQDIIFTHNEDERLALVILDVLKREKLSRKELKEWLDSFRDLPKGTSGIALNTKEFAAYQNCKHFLQALYFKLISNKDIPEANELEYRIYELMKDF